MTEYTPDEEHMEVAWIEYDDAATDINEAAAEFDRFLARVRREAAREALDGLIDAWLGKCGTPETRDAGIAVRDYRETNYRLPKETP